MKNLLLLMMAISPMLSAFAESLTLDRCVGLARENYPAIAQYGIIEKVKGLDVSNASKAWLPQGSVSGQLSWQNDVAAWPEQFAAMLAQQGIDFPGIDKTQYRVGVDVNQQIWDGGSQAASRRTIESAAEVERHSLDLQVYDIEGRVQDVYFGILMLEGRINSLDKSLALVDSTLVQVEAMVRNGVAMQSDCDQIEARLLTMQQQRRQLVAGRDSYQRVLEIFIGEPVGGRRLELPDVAELPDGNHPQMALFDAQIRNVGSREGEVRASSLPRIGAFASGYYGYPGYNMFKNMQTHDPSFNFMVGVKVAWNFGSLYTRRNSLDRLQLQRQQIETARETFLFNNSMATAEEESHIASLREMMQDDERIVALRQAVVCAARSQLRNGIIDATSLLAKITDAELAENDLILHNIELTKAIYNLNHIRNK